MASAMCVGRSICRRRVFFKRGRSSAAPSLFADGKRRAGSARRRPSSSRRPVRDDRRVRDRLEGVTTPERMNDSVRRTPTKRNRSRI